MCRLFGIRANRPVDVEFSLLAGPSPFCRLGNKHPDGWGVGWYVDGESVIKKEPVAAGDSELFRAAVAVVESSIVITHVRKATEGAKTRENCHPFRHTKWLFAHNGGLNRAQLLRQLQGEWRERLEGQTDSEVLFRWLLQNVAQEGNIVLGLKRAVQAVPPGFSSLNFLLADGESLYAYRNASRRKEYYSLFYLRRAPIDSQLEELRSKEVKALLHSKALRGERAVLECSERLTEESWQPIPLGHLLEVNGELVPRLLAVV
jgi:glutamine amidotransferase